LVIGGLFKNHISAIIRAEPTGHPFNLNSVAKKTIKINFAEKVLLSLEEKGYTDVTKVVLEQGVQESRITMTIPKQDHRGEQTKKEITKTVNHLAKENEIGSFKVVIKIKKS